MTTNEHLLPIITIVLAVVAVFYLFAQHLRKTRLRPLAPCEHHELPQDLQALLKQTAQQRLELGFDNIETFQFHEARMRSGYAVCFHKSNNTALVYAVCTTQFFTPHRTMGDLLRPFAPPFLPASWGGWRSERNKKTVVFTWIGFEAGDSKRVITVNKPIYLHPPETVIQQEFDTLHDLDGGWHQHERALEAIPQPLKNIRLLASTEGLHLLEGKLLPLPLSQPTTDY